jgi:PAS domain S-box-containing protein
MKSETLLSFPPSKLGRLRELTEELTAEETELYLFFKLAPDLFCLADSSGYLRKVNAAWTKILGWTEEELLTHQFFDFIHPEDVARTKSVMSHMSDQEVIRFHNRYQKKNSQDYEVLEWSATRWTDGLTYAAARPVPPACLLCPESEERFGNILGRNHRTGTVEKNGPN